MKKKMAVTSLCLMAMACVAGFILIFSSLSIGEKAGHAAMQANGGFMDTTAYYRVIDSTVDNYRTAGFVLALTGGAGVLLSGCGVYRELD